jgi:hypothetical protein
VVTLAILQYPSVKHWLGGIEPVWTLLNEASFAALSRPPSPVSGPIRLASDLTEPETQQSAIARNTLLLLRSAAAGPGLKTTATGNLSRDVVAKMCDLFAWPGFDRADAFRLHKIINEPDFLPLYFVRHLAGTAKLLRKHKDHLKATDAMDAMILRPLWWFGLLEHRQDEIAENRFDKKHFYRKTPLFDRFLSFDVTLETLAGPRH